MENQITVDDENRRIARDLHDDIFERHDLSTLPEYVAEDFVEYEGKDVSIEGIDGLRETFETILTAFPDIEWELIEEVADDERVVYNMLVRGTMEGDLPLPTGDVVEATGDRVEWNSFVSLRFEDGKIVESRALDDRLSLLAQIGVVPGMDDIAA